MKFWQEVDGLLLRQAAKHADAIRAAFIRSIDVADIIERWVQAYPAGGVVSAAEARVWAKQNIPVSRKPLGDALDHVYATGWVMGRDVSTAAYAHAQLGIKKAAPSAKDLNIALNTNWDTWKPGNRAAAQLVRPSGKFSQLLETGRAGIKGMNDTTLDRVGTLLADSLESGKAYSDLARNLLKDQITSRVVTDSARATTIAVTEISRALNTATVDNYNAFGVEKVEWLAIDTGTCDICPANEAQGPIPIGEMFESGDTEPPAHPNCRCTVLPVVVEGPEMTDEQFAQAIMDGDSEAVSEAIEPIESAALAQAGIAPTRDTFPDELASVKDYTSGSGAYSLVNDNLRGLYNASSAEVKQITQITTDLKTLIQNSPALTEAQTVSRGISSFNSRAIDKFVSLKTGDTFIDPAFLSTSRSTAVATGFTKGEGLVMQIELPKGTKSLDVGEYLQLAKNFEQEQILLPGTKFIVTAPARNINDVWFIGLKVVNG